MFTNVVVVPLSIGQAFHLAPAVVTASLERAFIYTGIACLLQALVGHRFPLMEGPAGLWWGFVLSLAASAGPTSQSLQSLGGSLAVGIILSGAIVVILGLLGIGWKMRVLFTPVVTSTFYFLLAAQLIQIFFKGMLGLADSTFIQPGIALLSVGLVVLVMALSIWGRGLISNFALLIGIAIGWPIFLLLFPAHVRTFAPAGASLFTLFPWGSLNLDPGIIITTVLAGLISLSNTYATLEGAEALFHTPIFAKRYKGSLVVTGFSSIVAGVLGLVPYAPYTSSIGFLRTTRLLERTPFLIGSILFLLLGVIPLLSQIFASLPISVGDAVLFVAYLQLFGPALSTLAGIAFSSRSLYRIATPVLLGLAVMTIPSSAFISLPALIRPLLQSGLVLGILLAMILEHIIPSSSSH